MKHNISLSTLLVLAALSLGAQAAESSKQPKNAPAASSAPVTDGQAPPIFEQLDVNHDGYLTLDEVKRSAEVTARFTELDRNHDGKITVAEFKNGMKDNP